jgi:membrane-associated phospholipid phosphatase
MINFIDFYVLLFYNKIKRITVKYIIASITLLICLSTVFFAINHPLSQEIGAILGLSFVSGLYSVYSMIPSKNYTESLDLVMVPMSFCMSICSLLFLATLT